MRELGRYANWRMEYKRDVTVFVSFLYSDALSRLFSQIREKSFLRDFIQSIEKKMQSIRHLSSTDTHTQETQIEITYEGKRVNRKKTEKRDGLTCTKVLFVLHTKRKRFDFFIQ